MSDNRAAVYLEDGIAIYRASSLGNCLGSLIRHRLGITPEPPPTWLQEKFNQGNVAEPVMLRALAENEGWKLLDGLVLGGYGRVGEDGQVETELKVGGKAVIRCHPDGVAQCFKHKIGDKWELKDRRVVEVKALGPDYYKKYKKEGVQGFPFYSWQLAIEMLSTGLPAIYGVGLKDADGMVDAEKVEWTHHYEPPHTLGEVMARVMLVERTVRGIEAGDVQLEDVECDWAMFPCGFWPEHDETRGVWAKQATSTPVDLDVALLDSLAMEYRVNKAIEKKAKEKASAASKGLAVLFVGDESGKFEGARFVVKGIVNEGREQFMVDDAVQAGDLSEEVRTKHTHRVGGYWYPRVEDTAKGESDG